MRGTPFNPRTGRYLALGGADSVPPGPAGPADPTDPSAPASNDTLIAKITADSPAGRIGGDTVRLLVYPGQDLASLSEAPAVADATKDSSLTDMHRGELVATRLVNGERRAFKLASSSLFPLIPPSELCARLYCATNVGENPPLNDINGAFSYISQATDHQEVLFGPRSFMAYVLMDSFMSMEDFLGSATKNTIVRGTLGSSPSLIASYWIGHSPVYARGGIETITVLESVISQASWVGQSLGRVYSPVSRHGEWSYDQGSHTGVGGTFGGRRSLGSYGTGSLPADAIAHGLLPYES